MWNTKKYRLCYSFLIFICNWLNTLDIVRELDIDRLDIVYDRCAICADPSSRNT